MDINRLPDMVSVEVEGNNNVDAQVRFQPSEHGYKVYLHSVKSKPKYIRLIWNTQISENALLCGDAWERTYADSEWKKIDSDRVMPWYFLCLENDVVTAAGVMVQPSSFVGWSASKNTVAATLDVRCGGCGVILNGRELLVCEIVMRAYNKSPYEAMCDFCSVMCPNPLLPKKPIYGGNNWYYAYGKSSRKEILQDAMLQAELAESLENRPYMVIDAGWELVTHSAPWFSKDSYGDMSEIARLMKEMDVHPGIWIRYLIDDRETTPIEWRNTHCPDGSEGHLQPLDPTVPEVMEHVKATTKQLVDWGYELIKHDFTTFDLFGNWCGGLPYVTEDGWHFHDQSRTSAEIVKDLYRVILESAGDALILGCNTISHLSAGLVHISRIGDDTSGYEWERTWKYGVNTVAFRLPQNNRFYVADADCVGIIPGKIPWEKNRQWLKLLSRSGSPLFISCAQGSLTPEQMQEVKEAYKYAACQSDIIEPLDWLDNLTPTHWKLASGEEFSFEW